MNAETPDLMAKHYSISGKTPSIQHLGEWFEGYRAVEAERDDLARRVEALRAAMEEALREVGELSNGDLREKIRESLAADDAARGDQ